MTPSDSLVFYHSPQSRSSSVLTLLTELNAPFELRLLNMKAGEQRLPAYLAVNPLGKVPAIQHRGQLVTEQVAIYLYLADLHAAAGLAPSIDDALRGPYLRWLVYYAACYEPALVDRSLKRDPAPLTTSPYGTFEAMLGNLIEQLARGPYLLGERFSAADVLWGNALNWGKMFGIVPAGPVVDDYVMRITSRPSFLDVAKRDAAWAEHHAAAAEAMHPTPM